ncbi:hypothetical protein P0M11_11250 [Kaistella sp. PBT33-4]|uniref:hypothetical protein n=1 Tax=Kaistella sp. PBT33-4 TaxID=3032000 RepID=UPI0023D8999C|nr:hypothetical protein [Kaistella sp. PBT33-4]MDF0720573.1 hypothetical protein [Kaistella sp. PBT33-4]
MKSAMGWEGEVSFFNFLFQLKQKSSFAEFGFAAESKCAFALKLQLKKAEPLSAAYLDV